MRLEGSLDAFSLPDIFQLLSFTKKTGGLHLRRDGQHGVVFVTTGSLTGGSSDVRRQALARRLVGSGAVEDAALSAAVANVHDDAELGVARALQQAGAVDEGVLHELGAEHVIDTVFDLLRWAEGDFVFVVDEVNSDDVGVSVPVEEAVAEARRRLETWSTVSTTVPSPDVVLSLSLNPPADPALSREEWALLALIDGRRPVSQVVAATGRGEYSVVSALASLVERGLLSVADDGEQSVIAALFGRLTALASLEGDAAVVVPPEPKPVSDERAAAEATAAAAEALAGLAAPTQRDASSAEPVRPRAEGVVPSRGESVLPRRRPDHVDDDSMMPTMPTVVGQVDGTAAVAAEPAPALIERDPTVNKSLLLRLIAGVRGL